MMDTTVKLDDVLDLVFTHQEELAATLARLSPGSLSYQYLTIEYQSLVKLYDEIRRLPQ
jgi:hypothetical protein